MSHFREIPLDEGAYDGRYHGLRDDRGMLHSGRWDADLQRFTYSNGVPIASMISAYNARLPGNPQSNGTQG